MTTREYNLRSRIDTLSDELDKVRGERDWHKARAKPHGRLPYPTACVYCGTRIKSRIYPATCACHRDLLALDPLYSEVAA